MNRKIIQRISTPKIVCIGGGTGLSTMLRGLKKYTQNVTAIVTVADDGGGSGILRDELGMPSPGDIRNCIQALSNIEPTMEKLLAYRFTNGHLKGQSFGNLFLAAMNGISSSFDEAVSRMGEVLAITGRVLPVTNEDIRLLTEFENGETVIGESNISAIMRGQSCRIKRVELVPSLAKALPESLDAIGSADMVVLGPGSLYTSLIPNLLVEGIAEAIEYSDAVKLFVCNIMSQPGETEKYTVSDHINAVFSHAGRKVFDNCLVNDAVLPEEFLEKYILEGAHQVHIDDGEVEKLGITLHKADVANRDSKFVRHNSDALAQEIMRIFRENSPTRIYKDN